MPSSDTAITHVIEPLLPGTLGIMTVGGMTDATRVLAFPLSDDPSAGPDANPAPPASVGPPLELPIVQRRDECLTLDLPPGDFGAWALQLTPVFDPATAWIANRPRLDWTFPNQPMPGGELRLHGRGLVSVNHYPAAVGDQPPVSYGGLLQGKTRVLARKVGSRRFTSLRVLASSAYEAHLRLPASFKSGRYELLAHNGHGGDLGWSQPLTIDLAQPQPWPDKVFRLEDYLDERRLIDEGLSRALADLEAHGGGVLELAAENYPIHQTIVLPRRCVLRGQGAGQTQILLPWGQGPRGPWIAITGEGDFVIEDLRLLGTYAAKLVMAPTFLPKSFEEAYHAPFTWSTTRARNVTIRRCYLEQRPRYNQPRRYDEPQFTAFLRRWVSEGEPQDDKGFNAVHFKGDGLVIENCEIWGGGSCIILPGCSYARISGNTLQVGVTGHGVYAMGHLDWPQDFATNPDAPGATILGNYSSQIILEDNAVRAYSDRTRDLVYFIYGCEDCHVARNTIGPVQINSDCEGLAFHLWSAKWATASLRMDEPLRGTILDPQGEVRRECLQGAAVEILAGRGVGQVRRVLQRQGQCVELDRPWIVEPDSTSLVCFTAPPPFQRMTLVDNQICKTGANILLWGNSNDVVLDGNSVEDNGHLTIWSIRLAADQKVWGGAAFTQVIHNTSRQAWARPHDPSRLLDTFGAVISNPCSADPTALRLGYDMLGLVIRDNLIQDDSGIVFRKTFPLGNGQDWVIYDAGIVIENNRMSRSRMGVVIEQGAMAIERHNTADQVRWPVVWAAPISSSPAVFNAPEKPPTKD